MVQQGGGGTQTTHRALFPSWTSTPACHGATPALRLTWNHRHLPGPPGADISGPALSSLLLPDQDATRRDPGKVTGQKDLISGPTKFRRHVPKPSFCSSSRCSSQGTHQLLASGVGCREGPDASTKTSPECEPCSRCVSTNPRCSRELGQGDAVFCTWLPPGRACWFFCLVLQSLAWAPLLRNAKPGNRSWGRPRLGRRRLTGTFVFFLSSFYFFKRLRLWV